MKDMNISEVLSRNRKERGITQEDLARYIGVSKASVSKWETGASFPDIVFLPQLASYFDMSIDDLLSYNPQLTKDDIRTLRLRLSSMVDKRPIEETLEETRGIIKKYFSCYPLLMQMGLFLFNNISAIGDAEQQQEVLRELADLFVRVHEGSDEVALTILALQMESLCYLTLGDPDTALDLLEDFSDEVNLAPALLVANAYQMKGNLVEAKRSLQVGLYQNLVLQMNFFSNYLMLVLDDTDAFETTLTRADAYMQTFELDRLHPCIYLSFELTEAVGLAQRGENNRCLDALERYAQVLTREFDALNLHGDAYFNLIDPWIENLESGSEMPRSNSMVKVDLVRMICDHPAFSVLSNEMRYKALVAKLEQLLEEN